MSYCALWHWLIRSFQEMRRFCPTNMPYPVSIADNTLSQGSLREGPERVPGLPGEGEDEMIQVQVEVHANRVSTLRGDTDEVTAPIAVPQNVSC